jgi:hypothetical protein
MVFDRALEPSEIQTIYNTGPDRDKCSPNSPPFLRTHHHSPERHAAFGALG